MRSARGSLESGTQAPGPMGDIGRLPRMERTCTPQMLSRSPRDASPASMSQEGKTQQRRAPRPSRICPVDSLDMVDNHPIAHGRRCVQHPAHRTPCPLGATFPGRRPPVLVSPAERHGRARVWQRLVSGSMIAPVTSDSARRFSAFVFMAAGRCGEHRASLWKHTRPEPHPREPRRTPHLGQNVPLAVLTPVSALL